MKEKTTGPFTNNFEVATRTANHLTKKYGEYYTAVPQENYPTLWSATNKYDPSVLKTNGIT